MDLRVEGCHVTFFSDNEGEMIFVIMEFTSVTSRFIGINKSFFTGKTFKLLD